MSNVQEWWTPERVAAAREILADYPSLCRAAVRDIGLKLDRTISYDALRNAFKRHGLGPPGSYCVSPLRDDLEERGEAADVGETERILIVPDAHRPYHSAHAWQLMLKAGRVLRPDRIILLGDVIDNYCLSSHGNKDPDRINRLKYEIDDTNVGLDELEALGAKRLDYISSNHDVRLDRFIADKCPELFGLVSIRQLLRLEERGWTWTPYRQALRVGHVHFTHDVGSAGKGAAAKARDLYAGNAVIGHVHRAEMSYAGNWRGEVHVGASFGWLGDPDKVDYLHRQAVAKSWTWGFGVGVHHVDSGAIHMQAVPIINGRCFVRDQWVVADEVANA